MKNFNHSITPITTPEPDSIPYHENQNLNHIQHSYRLNIYHQRLCDIYYKLHWQGDYLTQSVKYLEHLDELILHKHGITYLIRNKSSGIFSDATPYGISFRRVRGELYGYAVIKELKELKEISK